MEGTYGEPPVYSFLAEDSAAPRKTQYFRRSDKKAEAAIALIKSAMQEKEPSSDL